MDPGSEDTAAAPAIRFRAGKKRKAYRQRTDNDEDATVTSNNEGGNDAPESPKPTGDAAGISERAPRDDGEEESAVATALKKRNAARRGGRLRGVGFSSDSRVDEADQQLALIAASEDEKAVLKGIPDRFMHQTGMLTHLNDKHMTEYIESRLSSRSAPQDTNNITSDPGNPAAASSSSAQNTDRLLSDQPTKHGKLLEVDVPLSAWDDARRRANEAKRQRTDVPERPVKRGRNRRNSDDIKRDQLVEAFLHENKLDVYDVPQASASSAAGASGTYNPSTVANAADDGLSADDRMAQEFRQRYLDEVAMRRQKKRPVNQQPTRQQQQQAGDVLKGPKLGGSRNQRAAVRDALLKQEKERSGRRY